MISRQQMPDGTEAAVVTRQRQRAVSAHQDLARCDNCLRTSVRRTTLRSWTTHTPRSRVRPGAAVGLLQCVVCSIVLIAMLFDGLEVSLHGALNQHAAHRPATQGLRVLLHEAGQVVHEHDRLAGLVANRLLSVLVRILQGCVEGCIVVDPAAMLVLALPLRLKLAAKLIDGLLAADCHRRRRHCRRLRNRRCASILRQSGRPRG